MQVALWTLGILISFTLFIHPSLLPHSSSWPWLAMSGILFVLGSIALGARRDMPFGGRA